MRSLNTDLEDSEKPVISPLPSSVAIVPFPADTRHALGPFARSREHVDSYGSGMRTGKDITVFVSKGAQHFFACILSRAEFV